MVECAGQQLDLELALIVQQHIGQLQPLHYPASQLRVLNLLSTGTELEWGGGDGKGQSEPDPRR